MSKTREEWYDYMVIQKNTYVELQELTSTSKTAIWLKIFWVVSYVAWLLEQLFEQFKIDVQEVVEAGAVGTGKWYKRETLKFQYGDPLVWDENQFKYVYAEIDESKQIISQVAVSYSGDQVRLKLAKGEDGALEPLNATEINALNAYWKINKVAGTSIGVVSQVADDLLLEVDIIYDPLILNADGVLLADGATKPVEEAINSYVSNIEFDGRLWENKLEDAIQGASGVVNVNIISIKAKNGATPYNSYPNYYDSSAGYLALDPNSVITYTNV